MKEHPILFSAPMVRAILEGRKSQTRRVMKPQPDIIVGGFPAFDDMGDLLKYPAKYRVGDRLWVRETWRPKGHFPTGWPYEYRATAEADYTPTDGPWKPSIYMPRAASRITLEITEVRAERLQEITRPDAEHEGLDTFSTLYRNYNPLPLKSGAEWVTDPKESFRSLWEKINSRASWEANPYVWAISFQAMKLPGMDYEGD